ncbi:MAG: hypothetical protein H7323_14720, partial [Frankiales bacterium]|nr:hypothetical protein [Frankiales bacterium]
MLRRILALAASVTVVVPAALTLAPAQALGPLPDPTVSAVRLVDAVVLTGEQFGTWAVPSNVTVKAPATDLKDCQSFDKRCQQWLPRRSRPTRSWGWTPTTRSPSWPATPGRPHRPT